MNTSRITGIGYFVIFLTGIYANFVVLEGLMSDGDSATTSANILHQFDQFRWGFLSFIVMVLVDILLAIPLYRLLKPVHQQQAMLSSVLRVINGGIFFVALQSLFEVMHLYSGAGETNPEMAARTLALMERFSDIWMVGLIFFGLHLFVLGRLIFRAGYLPRVIGILLQLAAIGYLVDSFARFLLPSYPELQPWFEIASLIPGVVGEFSLTLWLLIKAPRIPSLSSPHLSLANS
jgi:hypothetical protein